MRHRKEPIRNGIDQVGKCLLVAALCTYHEIGVMPLPGCGVGYVPTLHLVWVSEGRAFFSWARSGPRHASLEAAATRRTAFLVSERVGGPVGPPHLGPVVDGRRLERWLLLVDSARRTAVLVRRHDVKRRTSQEVTLFTDRALPFTWTCCVEDSRS